MKSSTNINAGIQNLKSLDAASSNLDEKINAGVLNLNKLKQGIRKTGTRHLRI